MRLTYCFLCLLILSCSSKSSFQDEAVSFPEDLISKYNGISHTGKFEPINEDQKNYFAFSFFEQEQALIISIKENSNESYIKNSWNYSKVIQFPSALFIEAKGSKSDSGILFIVKNESGNQFLDDLLSIENQSFTNIILIEELLFYSLPKADLDSLLSSSYENIDAFYNQYIISKPPSKDKLAVHYFGFGCWASTTSPHSNAFCQISCPEDETPICYDSPDYVTCYCSAEVGEGD